MSITISPATKEAWNKAIAKCREAKPYVETIGHGQFTVKGSNGTKYSVTWTGGKGQELKATCGCPAGAKNKPCYHVPATANIYKLQVIERAAARTYSLDCSKCGETYQSENSAQFFCPACEEADRAAKVAKDFSDLFGDMPVVNRMRETE